MPGPSRNARRRLLPRTIPLPVIIVASNLRMEKSWKNRVFRRSQTQAHRTAPTGRAVPCTCGAGVPAPGQRSQEREFPVRGRRSAFGTAGVACGATVIAAKDNAESPLRIYGPGPNLADHRLIEVTGTGELILAGGAGNGYRLAELMGATNPSGWSGVLKVKTPAGATAGYILLYSNP